MQRVPQEARSQKTRKTALSPARRPRRTLRSLLWVKMRRTQPEHFSSGLASKRASARRVNEYTPLLLLGIEHIKRRALAGARLLQHDVAQVDFAPSHVAACRYLRAVRLITADMPPCEVPSYNSSSSSTIVKSWSSRNASSSRARV